MSCSSISVLKSHKSIILTYAEELSLMFYLPHQSDYLLNINEGYMNNSSTIYC